MTSRDYEDAAKQVEKRLREALAGVVGLRNPNFEETKARIEHVIREQLMEIAGGRQVGDDVAIVISRADDDPAKAEINLVPKTDAGRQLVATWEAIIQWDRGSTYGEGR